MSAGPLANRTVVVTGGARGIGAAVARLAQQQGAHVAVLDLVPAPEADCHIECDVASGRSVRAAFGEVRKSCGPVSVLVNNAGIAPAGRFEEFTEERWNQVLAVDLTSVFHFLASDAASYMTGVIADVNGGLF